MKGESHSVSYRAKAWTLVIAIGVLLLCGFTRYIKSDSAPYFMVKDSFEGECSQDKADKCYFVVLQPLSPVRFVATVTHLDEMPLHGQAQQCRISRIEEKGPENTYSRIHLTCKKWDGDINLVIFQPQ